MLETWFSRYADEEQKGKMLADGLLKFCEDLGTFGLELRYLAGYSLVRFVIIGV